jgi:hypothetical protein
MNTDTNTLTLDAVRTLRSQTGRGRRRAKAMTVAAAVEAPILEHRTKYAFLVRESPEYDLLLMQAMLEKTLEPYAHLPAVRRALELGCTPLLDNAEGQRVREELGAEVLYFADRRKRFGVRFVIDGVPFQYGMLSGAKSNTNRDNDWVQAVVTLVETYRPAALVAGPIGRFARRAKLFAELAECLAAHRTKAYCHEVPVGIDLTDIGGKAQWDALAKYAEFDYIASNTRMLTGVVWRLKKNQYPRPSLLPGYEKPYGKGPDEHIVLPTTDASTVSVVRRFIEMAADDFTELEIAEELAAMGLATRNPYLLKHFGPVPADEVQDPVRLVRTLFKHLPTYLDGTYHFTHEMTVPDHDTFLGLPVRRVDPYDAGYIEVVLDFGTPEGGWHDEQVIQRAIKRRLLELPPSDSTRYHNKELVKPLAGLVRYEDDGHEFALMSNETAQYELRRRPIEEARGSTTARRTTFNSNDGELVGRFDSLTLHRAVADMLRSLATGIATVEPCPDAPTTAVDVAALEAAIVEEQRRADGAASAAALTETEEARAAHVALQETALAEKARLRRELDAARRPVRRPTALMDARRIAALITVLDVADGPQPARLRRELRTVVSSLRFADVEAAKPTARLVGRFTIVADDGPLSVGPVERVVRNRARGGTPGTDTRKEGTRQRNLALALDLWLERATPEERQHIWESEEFNPRSYNRRMEKVLTPVVGPHVTSALIDCPIIEVRRAAIRPYLSHDLDDGLDTRLRQEVESVYRKNGFTWSKGWCPGGMTRERQVLAFIDRYAQDPDEGIPLGEVVSAFKFDEGVIHRMAHEGPFPYGRREPSPAPWYARLETHRVRTTGRSRTHVRVRRCLHCGRRTLTQPLRAPEVAGYLLCANVTCRKSLLLDVPYPSAFFEPWDGPQNTARRTADAGQTPALKDWMSEGGRAVVGAMTVPVVVPSRFAPRLPTVR